MANVQGPYGLKPVRHMTGGEVRANSYTIASGYATDLFTGDPVLQTTDGTIIRAIGAEGVASTQTVGVFGGCVYTDAQGSRKFSAYWPASTVATNIEAFVYDDPRIIFEIQADGTGIVEADKGALANFRIAAGNTRYGRSGAYLDSTLAATGKQLRILRLINDSVNAPGAYANVEVMFVQHAILGVVAGVGGIA